MLMENLSYGQKKVNFQFVLKLKDGDSWLVTLSQSMMVFFKLIDEEYEEAVKLIPLQANPN